jgi:hypothetical protein
MPDPSPSPEQPTSTVRNVVTVLLRVARTAWRVWVRLKIGKAGPAPSKKPPAEGKK